MVGGFKKNSFNRRTLVTQAIKAAAATRRGSGFSRYEPICIYQLAESMGLVVRFYDINMEGMYQKGTPPRIHLSSLRPLQRRVFNCAHELGHHVFEHGFLIDQLRVDAEAESWEDPKEFLADVFAGFVLMPTIGLRRAFSTRGWCAESAPPEQLYVVACEYGVGYSTLLTHMSVSMNSIRRDHIVALRRTTPKRLKSHFLGATPSEPLVVVDAYSTMKTLDAEVGTLLLLPRNTETVGGTLELQCDLDQGRLYRAVRPGIAQASAGPWSVFVRVAAKGYVGLAQYRHLEDVSDG